MMYGSVVLAETESVAVRIEKPSLLVDRKKTVTEITPTYFTNLDLAISDAMVLTRMAKAYPNFDF